MNERRIPRAHLQRAALGSREQEDTVPVMPALVEHLERKFPIRLTPSFPRDQAILTLDDQAEQRGQQAVIDYLRNLSNNPDNNS